MSPVEDLHDVSLGGASPVGCLDGDGDGKWSVGKRRWNPSHRHRDQGRSSCIGECEEREDAVAADTTMMAALGVPLRYRGVARQCWSLRRTHPR
jgi:hypothetical protein